MEQLIRSVQRLAAKHGYFLFSHKLQDGNEEKQKAILRTNFDKAIDSFFDRKPSRIYTDNQPERF